METSREPPVVLESKPLENPEEFESRRVMEENIIAALKNDNISKIGICGSVGIGKTRMARRIGERVKREKLFKVVVMVTVGPSADLKKIAYEISDYLSVRFEGGNFLARAYELLSKLIREERVLIILDDVREILDLEKIGIPLQKHKGPYKIIITSRFPRVCSAMGCDQIFTVQVLTERDIYCFLLKEKFGNSLGSPGLNFLRRSIAQESERLPVAAAAATGGMLKVKSKFWPDIVAEKNNLTPDISKLSALLRDFAGATSFQERESVEAIKVLPQLRGMLEMQGQKRRQTSFKKFLPPKRGQVRALIFKSLASSLVAKRTQSKDSVLSSGSNSKENHDSGSNTKNHDIISAFGFLPSSLQVLDLRDADIQELAGYMKELTNLRLLNLTNCCNLRIIEPGIISSLVRLEELYMLGSFSEWEVDKEGKRVNASINELEFLPNLTALQIQIQDPSIIPKSSRIWSRLTVYVILIPEKLKCRYEESLDVSFPAVNLDDYYWQFQRAMDVYLPSVTPLIDWICVMLRSAEYLCLKGDGSKNAVDELIPEGFKLLKQLNICHCSTMEYLVNGVDQVVLSNRFFPFLESLCLEDLLLFKEIFNSELPVGLFAELRNLKLYKLPALLHVFRSKTQGVSLSNLRSVHISDCPTLRRLFSLSMARDLLQLEEIKIEYCEMMEEIFSEEMCEHGKISDKIQFSKLNHLELDTLPHLTDFCKNVRIEFPQLRDMLIQSSRKLRTFCPTECDLPAEGNDVNGIQYLFNEKVFKDVDLLHGNSPSQRIYYSAHLSSALTNIPQQPEACNCNYHQTFRLGANFINFWEMTREALSLLILQVAFGSLRKLEIKELDSMTGIWSRQTSTSLFCELEVLVVASCGTLSNLFSHSIVKNLVQLEHLIVEDCPVMREVIAEDGEIGEPETNESLFPRLRKLELRRLPTLESFCHMMNGLELLSLEDLTLYDCPEMKKFSGGKLHMPVLRRVKKDISIYEIGGVSYSAQRLFEEKKLFIHQYQSFPSQHQVVEVEEMEEEVLEESFHSHLARSARSSQGSGGNGSASLQNAMNEKSLCPTLNQDTVTEGVVSNSPKSHSQELELGQDGGDEDAQTSPFCEGTKANGVQLEEINVEAKSKVSTDTVLHNDGYLEDFISFCSIFPFDYEFTEDILVWQWIAGGLIEMGEDEMEKACIKCFNTLLSMDLIVASRYDHFVDQMKYKIGDRMTIFLQKQQLEPKFRKFLDSRLTDMAKVEHLSLAFEQIDGMNFKVLKQYSGLQTLIIHRCYGYKVNHLPSDLFLELKVLTILNLSHTDIVELPSSVENLKELRYLDMSGTPIGWLPETICCFSNLQTLKLDGCLSLRGLPKSTSKLFNLRHLVLDVVRQLQSMPIGIGNLSKLRTLGAFLVGEDDGCRIRELKDMKKLRGSFRVLNLENVETKEEAAEACLFNKQDLRKIELQWSDLRDEKNTDDEEILESLRPPSSIQELKILFYSGGVLPSWISNPSFSELVKIILHRCRYCCSLPSLGELPSLKHLSVIENHEVMEIDSVFCRKQTDQHGVAFPKLEKLSFDSMSKLERWTSLENGDFPSLRHLIIEDCPKFVGLPSLSHLNALLHLEISCCPELSCLPEDGLPSTLESLMIKDCPKLDGRCCNEQREDWSKVAAHVPSVYIDNQKVSP